MIVSFKSMGTPIKQGGTAGEDDSSLTDFSLFRAFFYTLLQTNTHTGDNR